MPKLTKSQRAILGTDYSNDIYHSSYAYLHSLPNEDAYYEDEVEQTFEDFVEMGKREPNEQGTGRFTLHPGRNKLACVFFVDVKNVARNNNMHKDIQQYLSSFFGLDVDVIKLDKKAISVKSSTIHIGEYIYELDIFPKRSNQKKKRRVEDVNNQQPAIEVFSLFDSFESLIIEPYISVVAFVGHYLCEEDEEDDEGFHIVCGRACGDRIACVSLPLCDTLKDILCVATHELLHTIGFDHCNSWQCIMNASGNDSWLFLSPVNLRKFKVFHGIQDDKGQFVLKRYRTLLNTIKTISNNNSNNETNNNFDREIQWLIDKIRILETLIRT